MVVDIFTFNNELDALEIRLNILDPYVHKFVLVEATRTFSGHAKPMYYLENKKRFKQWEDKIHHFVIDDYSDEELLKMAYGSDNTGDKEKYWIGEFYQKEMIKWSLEWLKDEDICFVSDVDEIWNPAILPQIQGEKLYKPLQNLTYIYYLNNRTNENWKQFTGTIVTKYKNIKDACLNHLRTHHKNDYTYIQNGGWHFNALGGMEKKIDSFKHPVYTKEYMKSREVGAHKDESGLPQYLLDNREKYKHLWIE